MYHWSVDLHSRPAVGREYYSGYVDVWADNAAEAIKLAIRQLTRLHGHPDWMTDNVTLLLS
jgi:hypothetical protein